MNAALHKRTSSLSPRTADLASTVKMATFGVDLEDDVRSPTSSTAIGNGVNGMHHHHERKRSSAARMSVLSRPSMDEFGSDDGDDRSIEDVEDEMALLGDGTRGERQLRGRELSEKQSGSTWTQVKDIVVEVSGSCYDFCAKLIGRYCRLLRRCS